MVMMEVLLFVQTILYVVRSFGDIKVAGFIFNALISTYGFILVVLLIPATVFVVVLMLFHVFMVGTNQTTN